MIKQLMVLSILTLILTSCDDFFSSDSYGGSAIGVVEKVNDSTADYGLNGTYTPNNEGRKPITGKMRFSKGNKYNSAVYEGKKIHIEEADLWKADSIAQDWVTILLDYISQ